LVKNKLIIKVGGSAGSGVFTIGEMFAKSCQRMGYNVCYTTDYPSLIKGGHNTCCVRIEDEKIYSHLKKSDILVALDATTINEHYKELTEKGAIIYDSSSIKPEHFKVKRKDIKLIPVPLKEIAVANGNRLYANVVAVGAVAGLIDLHTEKLFSLLASNFKKKGQKVVDGNINACKSGYKYIIENFNDKFKSTLGELEEKNNIYITGNDAASIGAIKAGVKFVAEYPMTPSSSVLHFMAAHEQSHNIVVKHTEDELAAINMIIGAQMTGVRCLTATSGGGFALMSEGLGMAGIMEAPIVIIESQRTGPSTGMPTYTEQSDINFVLNASQGEFPRIVLCPGDVEECFYETFNVFNYAERVQTPAIVLIDKHLSASAWTTKRFDTSNLRVDRGRLLTDSDMNNAIWPFPRHEVTQNGISPRPVPGQPNGMYVSSSYEHDETGFTCETPQNRIDQVNKRDRKMRNISEDEISPKFYGVKDADITLVSTGSNKNMILEGMKFLAQDGYKVNFMHIIYLEPFAKNKISKFLKNCKRLLMVEQNKSGMLRDLINKHTQVYIDDGMFKYDGRPYDPEDIYMAVKERMSK
jgi:2-oxoglutarate/2-oxoacid ferredoxin oxidoreductase subunit alpha